ncbi:MAG: TIGR01777 family oxidoreductase [Pirellulaceae bacterium]
MNNQNHATLNDMKTPDVPAAEATEPDVRWHDRSGGQGPWRVAVSGSHGLIGSAVVSRFARGGHHVVRLVRHEPAEGEVAWSPADASFDASPLEGIDGVVHLAGSNIAAGRWTKARKQLLRESRIRGTRILSEGLARLSRPPKVLVAASAVGWYGDRGEELLDEQSPPGEGFLAELAQEWEGATRPATEVGIRVVALRFGVVLSAEDGALRKMLPAFRWGVAGALGSGQQYWSWISLEDAAGAIEHALQTNALTGPVNAVAPQPVTNRTFTETLGHVLHRPTRIAIPAAVIRFALGEMADALLLSSTRVVPRRLMETGYVFRHDDLEDALRHLLGRTT